MRRTGKHADAEALIKAHASVGLKKGTALILNADYRNANWQLLEERGSITGRAINQYVWSPIYIDALIERDRDADNSSLTGSNGLEERVFSQWDANFNVTSLAVLDTDAGTTGNQTGLSERYRCTAYGDRKALNADFSEDTMTGSDGTNSDDSSFASLHVKKGSLGNVQAPTHDNAGVVDVLDCITLRILV